MASGEDHRGITVIDFMRDWPSACPRTRRVDAVELFLERFLSTEHARDLTLTAFPAARAAAAHTDTAPGHGAQLLLTGRADNDLDLDTIRLLESTWRISRAASSWIPRQGMRIGSRFPPGFRRGAEARAGSSGIRGYRARPGGAVGAVRTGRRRGQRPPGTAEDGPRRASPPAHEQKKRALLQGTTELRRVFLSENREPGSRAEIPGALVPGPVGPADRAGRETRAGTRT